MKAITLWQPWATLIALGIKEFETRSWDAQYRGPLAIHAAKRKLDFQSELLLSELKSRGFDLPEIDELPFGAIVCTCDLIDCFNMPAVNRNFIREFLKHEPIKNWEIEQLVGGWGEGRYAWRLANVIPLPEPAYVKGSQGFWNWQQEPTKK